MWIRRKHHKVFSRFHRWSGRVPAGFDVDFLGTRYRTDYFTMYQPQPQERFEAPQHPAFDEEYFEWIDLLEAVLGAEKRFTMLELGAGFGRWTARAAAAARQRDLPYFLVAVEAEPTRFQWLLQNLQDNGIKLEDCRLVHAAATSKDGTVGFQVGDPANDYGRSIGGGGTEIPAISLSTLVLPLNFVDLIDLDIQGAELEVLEAATSPLAQKVKRVHVETHSAQVHAGVHKLFRALGWKSHFLFEGNSADTTPWGRIDFQGGTQSWLNPKLCSRDELGYIRTVGNSAAWRTVNTGRKIIHRVTRPGTLLRRASNKALTRLGKKYLRDPKDFDRRPMTW